MSNGMIRFKGTLTAESPVTVSYINMENRLPRTPHGEVYLNAGTFRGPLRKAALRAVRRLLAAHQERDEKGLMSLTDMYMLGSGVDRTRSVNNELENAIDPVGEQFLRELNPLLSLFGRWRLSSRLEVSEMRTPETNLVTAGQGVRHDQFERDPSEVTLLSEDDQNTLLSEIRSARASAKEIDNIRQSAREKRREIAITEDAARRKELSAELKALEKSEADTRSAREGAEQSIKHPINGYESICAGATMSSTIGLINGSQIYLGILLHALAEFAREPYLGGHRSAGFGRVTGEYEVFRWIPGKLQPEVIGTFAFNSDGVDVSGDELLEAYDSLSTLMEGCRFDIHTIEGARAAQETA